MKVYPQCIPCLINQGLNAVKRLGLTKEQEKEIATRSLKMLAQFENLERSPAYYAYFVQQIVKEVTDNPDPFREQKRLANKVALSLLPEFMQYIHSQTDRLAYAIRLSALGNYIDLAIRGEFNVKEEIERLIDTDFAVWDYKVFLKKLESATKVLIIGDNAGEIALDKVLVKQLKDFGKNVIYAVKSAPILNDATLEDAIEVSMTSICKVIENGSDKVGTWLEDCSEEFLEAFYSSDIVISKGQANFETLSDVDRDVFFLLVAKCEPIASESGGKVKNFVFKYKGSK